MTIDEKRKFLLNFCNAERNCEKCVLNVGGWDIPTVSTDECLAIRLSPEKDLDRAIALIKSDTKIKNDNVNCPAHYTDGKIEVIDFIEDKKLGFCLGNAIKYIARAGKKDPTKEIEDLKKAAWYINRRIKEIEEGIV